MRNSETAVYILTMRHVILVCIFMVPASVWCQHKYDYQWVFGDGADIEAGYAISRLDFNDGVIEVLPHAEVEVFELSNSGSFICDNQGQVKLMTNNCEIVDANFNVIEGGMEITPGVTYDDYCDLGDYPSDQCTIFLPDMSKDSITYLIHKDSRIIGELQDVPSENLYLSVIVERPDGSFYVKEKQVLIESTLMLWGRLTGVLNSTLDKWWIYVVGYDSNRFYKFLIGGEEIVEGPFIQDIGPVISNFDLDVGQAAFSPNAEYLAINSEAYGVILYDFDAESGTLSNYRSIAYPAMDRANGLVFSPNSRFIYVNGVEDVYQIDLEPEAGDSAVLHLGNLGMQDINGWPVGTGLMYLGPDCRIYISPGSTSRVIHAIHKPDEKGLACEIEQAAIRTPTRVEFNLPNLPMYRFGGSCDSTIAWGIVSEVEEPEEEEVGAWLAPNPATGYTTVILPEEHRCQSLSLLDVQGREVKQVQVREGQSQVRLNIQDMAAGVYLIRFNAVDMAPLKLVVR